MALLTLVDGKITQPGAYRMEMDEYHSQSICPGPSFSSTQLRKIYADSPWHFWASSELNPNRYPEKEQSDGLILGKAAHSLILGDEVFDDHFIYLPEGAPPRPTVAQIKAFERDGVWSDSAAPRAEFWDDWDKRAKGRLILTQEQVQKIQYMAENLAREPLAVEALTGGNVEVSLIWEDEQTGLWLKARPDTLPDAGPNGFDVADLKTFAPRGKRGFAAEMQRAITDHRYDMQAALVLMGFEAIFGIGAEKVIYPFCQTTEPYPVGVTILDAESLYWAKVCIRKAINTAAECLETGHWPMPTEGQLVTYSIPPSLSEKYSDMQAAGLLPNL